MKIRFIVNRQYDSDVFFDLLRQSHWQSRIISSGISYGLAKEIHDANTDVEVKKLKNKFEKIIDDSYYRCHLYLEKSKKLYQASWDEIICDFSKTVSELTRPWFYKEYICVVTHFCQGVSNWNGNIIGRTWKENPFTQRRITAHEIILAHYFSILRNNYPNSGLNDKQIWALAEITAFALTGLEPKLKQFWPWDNQGYYSNHNYPEIVKLQMKLKEPFLNRKDFNEYVNLGIEEIKRAKLFTNEN